MPAFESVFGKWAEFHLEIVDRDFQSAYKMWKLTKDKKWGEVAKREMDRAIEAKTEVDRG